MKLIKALELAEECGLGTVMEAFRNIQIHADQLFTYETMDEEYAEILREWYCLDDDRRFSYKSSVREVLEWMRNREKGSKLI